MIIARFLQRFAKNMTEPMGLSVLPICVVVVAGTQITQWHWTDRAGDWRGWAGFLVAWIAAYLLEAVIRAVRGWLTWRHPDIHADACTCHGTGRFT